MKLVLIGGVGGSGTRVVAKAFRDNGIFIGSHLNNSLDNLDWPGNIDLILRRDLSFNEKVERLKSDFQAFFKKMIDESSSGDFNRDIVATKVPGSFYYLPYICQFFDQVSYIHVIRHGLDMAFSGNKNQLRNWGSMFNLDCSSEDCSESRQLKYWLSANAYALKLQDELPLDCSELIQFERFCRQTSTEVERIFNKLGVDVDISDSFFESVDLPESVGRYRGQDLSIFDDEDLLSVSRLGYKV
ncbi:sulfotransferase [Amphritea pacifica]|uniref:Sulfotransferase n=1 Tax=Amphritea pacifica TaxID=2811233 RepID=A0ABS2WDP9_9GAMM|nr:sulfotransferase [Amphritea pacifica]MBN0989838.1 sulfotransferase [Amphritea pacifica]MBN1006606.1 sulfotransferase [Amphritea pacifica]